MVKRFVLGVFANSDVEGAFFSIVLGPTASLCELCGEGPIHPRLSEVDVHFTIREAQPGDVAVLAQLLCELGYETTESEMEMRMERIATDERYRTFVAVRDGKVCGDDRHFRLLQLCP